jgi:ABC-type multidrug transport system ATPase subunit
MIPERLALRQVEFIPRGASVSMSVFGTQRIAIMGPARSGKSRALRILFGEEKPTAGNVAHSGERTRIPAGSLRRQKVQHALRRPGAKDTASRVTEWLVALGLWEQRATPVGELSYADECIVETLAALASDADLIGLDGTLDALDPWQLPGVMKILNASRRDGQAQLIVTSRPEIARHCDGLILMVAQDVRFAGRRDDFMREFAPGTVRVQTERHALVRNIVAPFRVSIESTEDGLRITAPEAQSVAARLLTEGYGDIDTVWLNPPTFEDALRRAVSG